MAATAALLEEKSELPAMRARMQTAIQQSLVMVKRPSPLHGTEPGMETEALGSRASSPAFVRQGFATKAADSKKDGRQKT